MLPHVVPVGSTRVVFAMPVWNESDDDLFVAPKFAKDMFLRYACYDDEFG